MATENVTAEEPAAAEAAPALAPEDGEKEVAENALQENIQRKGQTAYYYAHAHRVDAPKWDGQEEPRLLERRSPSASAEAPTVVQRQIKKYAWNDEKAKVKLYIGLDEVGQVAEGGVKVDYTSTTATLSITSVAGPVYVLSLLNLYDTIEEATFRQKPDKVILTLKKASSFAWHDLKKAGAN
eukprot:CAMPEP_0118978484 /NCGR_PEP_ID=MMETSP1173-20130426/23791_1 /TAXON_ID=1034831 /ORGANISM="Rhizochromulina marina cf, Strain CCMP1243" /LENGTH=181 /DNA_ID=CAMNT_0006928681 /DNA_START=18 /DNA_END=563 /DNA_ORIENTATION=+